MPYHHVFAASYQAADKEEQTAIAILKMGETGQLTLHYLFAKSSPISNGSLKKKQPTRPLFATGS